MGWLAAAGTCQEWANAYTSFTTGNKDRCYMGPVKPDKKDHYEQKPVKCDQGYKIYDSEKLLVLKGIGYQWRDESDSSPTSFWSDRWFLADRNFDEALTGFQLNTWKSNCCIPDSKNKPQPQPTKCTDAPFDCPNGYWNRGYHEFKDLKFGTGKSSKRIVTHFTGCCYSKIIMSEYYVYSSPAKDFNKLPKMKREPTMAARCVGDCSCTGIPPDVKDWCFSEVKYTNVKGQRAGYCQEGTKFNAFQWAGFQDKGSCKEERIAEGVWNSCMDDGFGDEFCCLNSKWMYHPKESVAKTMNAVLYKRN